MRRSWSRATLLLAAAVLVGACGASSDGDGGASSPAATTPPVIEPGAVATGRVVVDGTPIEYVASVPTGFEPGGDAPLLLALPPGSQDLTLAHRLVENTYAAEASRLGWVVVSPAAPDGVKFFSGSEDLLPGFVDWVETWVVPEGGAPHVAGVSNGGISAFRYAAANPDRTGSVVAFPGFARSVDDVEALDELADVPIRIFVGGDDTAWVRSGEETLAAAERAGLDVELTVFPGEGHIMDSTADGVLVFEQLESFR